MLVEIWSDVVCPWCAIGKARFEQALEGFAHADEVEVVWRSFELDPRAPQQLPESLGEHLAAKYGTSLEGAQQMMDRMEQAAAEDGLTFRFGIAKPGNTFDAHRLLHLAKARGLQDEVGTALFSAYLTEGRAIGDHEVLREVAVAAGLDEVEVKEVLATDAHADDVRADEAKAAEYGIRGVPFFVVDQQYGVSGAQPAESLRYLLEQAWSARQPTPLQMVAEDGDGCVDGECAV